MSSSTNTNDNEKVYKLVQNLIKEKDKKKNEFNQLLDDVKKKFATEFNVEKSSAQLIQQIKKRIAEIENDVGDDTKGIIEKFNITATALITKFNPASSEVTLKELKNSVSNKNQLDNFNELKQLLDDIDVNINLLKSFFDINTSKNTWKNKIIRIFRNSEVNKLKKSINDSKTFTGFNKYENTEINNFITNIDDKISGLSKKAKEELKKFLESKIIYVYKREDGTYDIVPQSIFKLNGTGLTKYKQNKNNKDVYYGEFTQNGNTKVYNPINFPAVKVDKINQNYIITKDNSIKGGLKKKGEKLYGIQQNEVKYNLSLKDLINEINKYRSVSRMKKVVTIKKESALKNTAFQNKNSLKAYINLLSEKKTNEAKEVKEAIKKAYNISSFHSNKISGSKEPKIYKNIINAIAKYDYNVYNNSSGFKNQTNIQTNLFTPYQNDFVALLEKLFNELNNKFNNTTGTTFKSSVDDISYDTNVKDIINISITKTLVELYTIINGINDKIENICNEIENIRTTGGNINLLATAKKDFKDLFETFKSEYKQLLTTHKTNINKILLKGYPDDRKQIFRNELVYNLIVKIISKNIKETFDKDYPQNSNINKKILNFEVKNFGKNETKKLIKV